MVSLEGGCWKSAQSSNSLAAYPTVRCVLGGGSGSNIILLPDNMIRKGQIEGVGRKDIRGQVGFVAGLFRIAA
jgi:hypothetical protein